jgi:hypothetical protein
MWEMTATEAMADKQKEFKALCKGVVEACIKGVRKWFTRYQ